MLYTMNQRGNLTKRRVREDFRAWLREAAHRRGLSQSDLGWEFPFQVSPGTIEAWYQGRATPDLANFVGLCLVLGELPPVLQELCDPAPSE